MVLAPATFVSARSGVPLNVPRTSAGNPYKAASPVHELETNIIEGVHRSRDMAQQTVTLDKTDLDHAHLQCDDLEVRPWWTAP